MKIFVAVFINNLKRLAQQKQRILVFPILTILAIACAIFLNTRPVMLGSIMVVGDEAIISELTELINCQYLNVSVSQQSPKLSSLVSGRYDAVVKYDTQRDYEILTIKSEEFKETLNAIISSPGINPFPASMNRGNGTNIIGFTLMFVLMQGVSLMFLFAEDKEKHQLRRIAASPISFIGYVFAHFVSAYILLFLPTAIMLTVAYVIPGVDMRFSLISCMLLNLLQCMFAITIGMLLVATFKKSDWANMAGSSIVLMMSVLSGSFYPFEKGNRVLEAIVKILPTKSFLVISESLEKGMRFSSFTFELTYITVCITIFLLITNMKTRKDYEEGR